MEIKVIEEKKKLVRKLSVKEVMMILDGIKEVLGTKIIPYLPDTENGISLVPLKTVLCVHIYLPLKKVVDHYDKKLNGIYSPKIKKY